MANDEGRKMDMGVIQASWPLQQFQWPIDNEFLSKSP